MTLASEPRTDSSPPPALTISVALVRLADTVRAELEQALNGSGVSWARYEILSCLTRLGALTYSDLAHALVRHRTSIAATVGFLETAGLVVREANPDKPQQHLVRLTTRGDTVRLKAERVLARRFSAGSDNTRQALDALRALEQRMTALR
ncbi:MarR family winged helix-turn-helix transcriptional regulator [Rhodococcus sp. NPDC057297]|uniref:MarR family winged helix-turn-helix transcriptional regulator n=1 Tax=Rhodococcus sp. NPDC057297 TaxID=3346090 RepID=UPI003629F14F